MIKDNKLIGRGINLTCIRLDMVRAILSPAYRFTANHERKTKFN